MKVDTNDVENAQTWTKMESVQTIMWYKQHILEG